MKKNALDELAMTPRRPTKKELMEAAREYLEMRMHDQIPIILMENGSDGMAGE